MRFNKQALAFVCVLTFSGCGSSLGSSSGSSASSGTKASGPTNPTTLPSLSGDNIIPVSVNGSTCSANSYPNKPCVSVTICTPGTTTCQTINDILLDTGSYGLRLFSSTVTVSLTQQMSGSRPVAQCVQFGDGSSDWGPIKIADVVLGNEAAVRIPIQVIDSTFAKANTYCSGAETGPSQAGLNGILGVGMFAQDCGSTCATHADTGIYYSCDSSSSTASCTGVLEAVTDQVTNPVAAQATDNNGHILQMPSVAAGGVASTQGYLVLGIGTRSNNTASGVTTYQASSSNGQIVTVFNGNSYGAFLDSGSNALYFGSYSGAPNCKTTNAQYDGWYCPTSTQTVSATNSAGSQSASVSFMIGNFITLWNSTNYVFAEMAGIGEATTFDWGLPFYLGRNVYQGIEGTTSNVGSGTYWAY